MAMGGRGRGYNNAAPTSYVAGLGRGATGFTTRSDIGPARAAEGATDLSESNFDQFSGYSESLAKDLPYDQDDEAADRVWSEVDSKMDERRRTRREEKLQESLDKFRAVRPKLQHQFGDLKRDLALVSRDEWENLPEPGEHRKSRAQERRNERFMAAPDTLLEKVSRALQKSRLSLQQDASPRHSPWQKLQPSNFCRRQVPSTRILRPASERLLRETLFCSQVPSTPLVV